jgi:hypothetical protein
VTDSVAERTLKYRGTSGGELKTLTVRVLPPFLLQEGQVNFPFHPGTSGCIVRVEGLPEALEEVTYGADALQALELAVNGVEPMLRRVGKHTELFFPTGEPYFEDE